ncbi:MAG: alcohol dehydrogenase catalytic domain-containing protein [Acidobacteria bacterium]|nr:alcohol dehydrogenase catalytic domain-containing protein [Acidobacteriota bacterium]
MMAAVYTGQGQIAIQSIPIPSLLPGEILVRVEACGICHTDLKKVEHDLLPPPRIYGHESAGVVAAVGAGVTRFKPGDRVVAFHHIPCRDCFYCQRKLYAQCETYKKVGITAGFEPAGGGFSQYIRIMDWIVRDGVELIPEGVSFEAASFVEPVNTCHKAVVLANPQPGDVVLVQGQGPIGLIFTMLVKRTGATVVTTDTIPERMALSRRFGAAETWDPRQVDVAAECRRLTAGRGVDQVFIAASVPGIVGQAIAASRPGSKILLFAQTSDTERIELSGAGICKLERTLFGCYSASVDLQAESARLVFSGDLPVEELISHRLPLRAISQGIQLALHPDGKSLKIVVQPQRLS